MEEKILIQIDAFPNTRDKIEITKLCIKSLKNLGHPILLTSHIEIPKDLSDLCDFSFSDFNNILLPPGNDPYFINFTCGSFSMRFLEKNVDSHTPSCLSSGINGAKFAKENGFNFFLHVEYDIILNSESIRNVKSLIETAKLCDGFIFSSSREWMPGEFYMMNPDTFLNSFYMEIGTPEDYKKFCSEIEVDEFNNRLIGLVYYQALKKSNAIYKLIEIPVQNGENRVYVNSVPKELQRNFPGFFRPLPFEDPNGMRFISLSVFGMGGEIKSEYRIEMKENGETISVETHEFHFIEGSASYRLIEFNSLFEYKISYVDPISGKNNQYLIKNFEDLSQFGKFTTV